MRAKVIAAVGGLLLTVALGAPAGAQVASRSGIAPAGASAGPATGAAPCGDVINDQATGGYSSDVIDSQEVYFVGEAGIVQYGTTNYCNVSVGHSGRFEIVDQNTLGCLDVSTQTVVLGEDTTLACDQAVADPNANPWAQWTATNVGTYHSQTVWMFRNVFNGQCMYDDSVNSPAIYTGCSTSGAERFIWSQLP